MENYKEYRQKVAKQITETPKEHRKSLFGKIKATKEYQDAERKYKGELPIAKFEGKIKEVLRNNETCVIVGSTGSGKTTKIPGYLLDVCENSGKIIVTQPRPLAASSVCGFVAKEKGVVVGEEIGYQTRFDNHTTEGTKLNFITDGIMLRILQSNPTLEGYGAVMVDEAHERSQNIDFVLGLLKKVQKKRIELNMPPIKIVVTSATIEKEKFANYFNSSPVVEVPGKLFPVEISYEEEKDGRRRDETDKAAEKVDNILKESPEGDILIFMPGELEISITIEKIKRSEEYKTKEANIEILPLFGQMSPEDQNKIFTKNGKRKIIVSTNIAETSITLPGIVHVIDSCLIKRLNYDHDSGIESLETVCHSKAGLKQRSGRAGRVQNGYCHRLIGENQYNSLPEFSTPEITRSNLSNVVLTMKKLNIDPVEFDFIDPPEKEAIAEAVKVLKELGALDKEGNITKTGELINELPLDPHIGRIIIESAKNNNAGTMCTIAAFLSGKNVFVRPREKASEADSAHRAFKDDQSDFATLLNVWNKYVEKNYNYKWAVENFLNGKVLAEVATIRQQLFRILKKYGIPATENQDKDTMGKCVTAGLLDKIFTKGYRHSYEKVERFNGSGKSTAARIHPSSALFSSAPRILAANEIRSTSDRGEPYAVQCQEVKPEWLFDLAPELFTKQEETYKYDKNSDKLTKSITYRMRNADVTFDNKEECAQERNETFAKRYFEEDAEFIVGHFTYEKNYIQEQLDVFSEKTSTIKSKKFSFDSWPNSISKIREKIGQKKIISRKDLLKEKEENPAFFDMTIDDFISKEEQEEINDLRPDNINILGVDKHVLYNKTWGRTRVSISVEEFKELKDWPRFKDGAILSMTIKGIGIVEPESDESTITEAIEKAKYEEMVKLFEENPELVHFEEDIESRDIAEIGSITPKKQYYGTSEIDGEDYYAFTGIETKSERIRNRYFLNEKNALEATKSTINIIQEKASEEKKSIENKEAIAVIEAIKKDFYENYQYVSGRISLPLTRKLNDMLNALPRIVFWWTKENADQIKDVFEELKKVISNLEQLDNIMEKINKECPVCKRELRDNGVCRIDHEEFVTEEIKKQEGEVTFPLWTYTNERGEILLAAVLKKKESYNKGEWQYFVETKYGRNIEKSEDIGLTEDIKIWDRTESFSEIKFDKGIKIKTIQEIQNDKRKTIKKEYIEHPWKYDQEQRNIDQDIETSPKQYGKSKFIREERGNEEMEWFIYIDNQKYYVKPNNENVVPLTEETEYYFAVNSVQENTVEIRNPLPECKPTEKEIEANERKKKVPYETPETNADAPNTDGLSVEELVALWNKKNKK